MFNVRLILVRRVKLLPLPHNIPGFLRSKVIFEPIQKLSQAITPLPGILSFSN